MRKFGLILENVDGFDDLPNKFVMRSVPHTLAMPNTLKPGILDETHPPFSLSPAGEIDGVVTALPGWHFYTC
jgi:hypothetical protein